MAGSIIRSLWLLPAISSFFSFNPIERSDTNNPPFIGSDIREGYDFIVIGAGTAGCVIANRLSEDPTVNVLLLEAGGPEPPEAQIPAVAPYLQLTELDWKFQAEPSSTYCLAMKDKQCNLPRGKILGGSSSINYMLYVRGNKKDYDLWEAFGNPGWNFESVLPYFKKSEDNKDPHIVKDGKYHGTGGYQTIKEAPWKTPLAEAFVEAGKELNYTKVDVNAEQQTGFMIPQGYQHQGARNSASRAFLRPISKRTNLDILLDATVTKVLLNKDNRVYGVNYERYSEVHTVKVSKEVVLSAGAFGSAQILLLSGIGPETHLRSLGIMPIVNLPVGRNLQDHVATGVTFSINQPISIKKSTLTSFKTGYQYSLFGSGPLTTFGGVEGIAFVNTKFADEKADWPDIEFHFLSGSQASDNGIYLPTTLNLRDEYWNDYLSSLADVDTFTVIAKLMRPASRGYVELRSLDPHDKPKIVTNYFKEAIDLLVLREGAKIAKAVGEANSFKKFGSKHFDRPLPGCEKLIDQPDSYWECYLRHFTLTIYHYSGTAKMGPYWDPGAVVDPSLRVYGTSGLRVADASIFPTIPTGNTNAAVLLVAEKVSDMIKDYWTSATEVPSSKLAENAQVLPHTEIMNDDKQKFNSPMKLSLHQIKKRSLEFHGNEESNRIKNGDGKDIAVPTTSSKLGASDKNAELPSASSIVQTSERNTLAPATSSKLQAFENDILALSSSFINFISKSVDSQISNNSENLPENLNESSKLSHNKDGQNDPPKESSDNYGTKPKREGLRAIFNQYRPIEKAKRPSQNINSERNDNIYVNKYNKFDEVNKLKINLMRSNKAQAYRANQNVLNDKLAGSNGIMGANFMKSSFNSQKFKLAAGKLKSVTSKVFNDSHVDLSRIGERSNNTISEETSGAGEVKADSTTEAAADNSTLFRVDL